MRSPRKRSLLPLGPVLSPRCSNSENLPELEFQIWTLRPRLGSASGGAGAEQKAGSSTHPLPGRGPRPA